MYVKTDGGAKSSGFNEHNDCAVRAYAIFRDIPYSNAHETFRKLGRRDRCATENHLIYSLLEKEGFKRNTVRGQGVTLRQLIAMNSHFPGRRIYALKRGHAIAIVGGVIHDSFLSGLKSRINDYWVSDVVGTTVPAAPAPVVPAAPRTMPVPKPSMWVKPTPEQFNSFGKSAQVYHLWMEHRGTKSNYAIAKIAAAKLGITVANANYYVMKIVKAPD